MKKFLLLSLLIFTTSSFSKTNEATFYNEGIDKVPDKCLFHLSNMGSSSLATGLLVNGSRTGLGDKNPVTKKVKAQGLYYQGLNIVSLMDQEFMRQVYHKRLGCLPEEIGILVGTFDQKFIQSRVPSKRKMVKKVERSLRIMFPDFPELEVRKMPDEEFRFSAEQPWKGETYNVLRKAIDRQLAEINGLTKGPTKIDIVKKLQVIYHAFVPLSTWSYINLPKENTRDGSIKASVIMPPFHQLRGEDKEDPKSWFLEKGLKMTELPKIINISVAKLTHLAYLEKQKKFVKNLIRFDFSKDFRKPHEVDTEVSFGRLYEKNKGIYVSTAHHEDALVVRFNFHLQVFEKDNAMVKKIKGFMNKLGENFITDARIHKLGIKLKRNAQDTTASGTFDEAIFKPTFSLEKSKISFRIYRKTKKKREKKALEMARFKCVKEGELFICSRDYWTWDTFFDDVESGRLLTLKTGKFRRFSDRILAKTAGAFTKFIINTNIKRIESAIDMELMEVLEYYMEKFANGRKTINERINKGLFKP